MKKLIVLAFIIVLYCSACTNSSTSISNEQVEYFYVYSLSSKHSYILLGKSKDMGTVVYNSNFVRGRWIKFEMENGKSIEVFFTVGTPLMITKTLLPYSNTAFIK